MGYGAAIGWMLGGRDVLICGGIFTRFAGAMTEIWVSYDRLAKLEAGRNFQEFVNVRKVTSMRFA